MTDFEKKINSLIKVDEDVYHDFKLEWYDKHHRDEMIKDIFAFVNTTHHEDCYLIIGVRDSDLKVVGVDGDKNRLTTDKLTQYINDLPIANHSVPNTKVKSLKIDNQDRKSVV